MPSPTNHCPDIYQLPDSSVRESRTFPRACDTVLAMARKALGTINQDPLLQRLFELAQGTNVDFALDTNSESPRILPVVTIEVLNDDGILMEKRWEPERFDMHQLYPEQEFAAIQGAFANVRIRLLEAASVAIAKKDVAGMTQVNEEAKKMVGLYKTFWDELRNRRRN